MDTTTDLTPLGHPERAPRPLIPVAAIDSLRHAVSVIDSLVLGYFEAAEDAALYGRAIAERNYWSLSVPKDLDSID